MTYPLRVFRHEDGKVPHRAFRAWSKAADAILAELIRMGVKHRIIARQLRRTEAAISHRASALGITSPRRAPQTLLKLMEISK